MLLCVLLLWARRAAAQHQYDRWYFGPGLGVDFSTGVPVVANNGAQRTGEGSASISDPATGALLFYTEGLTVYDRTHQPMPSGAGLLGSKTSAQSALIVPFPCDSNRYYIFTTDQEGYAGPPNQGLHYSVVDMTRNGGKGDVTVVNTPLLPQSSEHLTAVVHANGHDAWVIAHSLGGNTFFAFQVTSAGVSPNPVISQVGTPMGNPVASGDWTPGYLKPSPDGSKLAIAANELDLVEIFQFNNATGAVANPITIAGPKAPGNVSVFLPYGLSFSPDNTKFYCGYGKKVVQYQVLPYTAAAVLASRVVIVDPAAAPGAPSIDGAMQIGPDGRIYTVTDPQWLGVISNPNVAGQGCNFSRAAVQVGTPAGRAFLGLPNCIDSRPWFSACCTPPVVTVTASGPTVFCEGDSVTLTGPAGFASYDWSNGDRTRATVIRTTGSYTLTVADGSGCGGDTTIAVRVNPRPSPTIIPSGPTTFCDGDSVTLAAPSGLAGYRWSTGAISRSIVVRTSGTYGVAVTDANGCGSSATIDVHVNAKPSAAITPSGPTTFCDGDSVTLAAPSGLVAYRWSTGDTTREIIVKSGGAYAVAVADANGCDSSATIVVHVNAKPTPSITASGPTTFCSGDSVRLAADPGYAAYRWSDGSTGDAIIARSSGTYTVAVTDANGCENSATIAVHVNARPLPVITPSGPTTFCDGDSVTLAAPAGLAGYRWSTGETVREIVVRMSGTYGIAVTDTNGCDSSASIDVMVNVRPSAAITASGPTTFCDGDSVNLAAPSGLVAYRWSTGDTTREIVVKKGGAYDVAVTDANGCGNSATIAVHVNAKPNPVITPSGPTTFCDGDSVTLAAPSGFTAYRWSDGSTGETIVARQSGLYEVAVTDVNGCANSASIDVHVNAKPAPVITPSGSTTFCDGDRVVLTGDSGYAAYLWSTGDTARAITVRSSGTYRLRVIDLNGCSADTAVAVTVNPNPAPIISGRLGFCDGDSTLLDAGADYAAYRWSTGDTTRMITVDRSDTFSVAVANGFGCWTRSRPVTTHRFMSVDATITPLGSPIICDGDSTVLAAPAGHIDYRWSTGDSTQVIVVRAAGSYSVTVIDTNGCHGSASFTVTTIPRPAPTIVPSGPTTFCEGGSVVLDAGEGYASYQWSSGELTREIVVREPGVYRVAVINANGCTGISDSIAVTVAPRPSISINGPSTICPNSEGIYSVAAAAGEHYRWSVSGAGGSIVAGDGTSEITVRWGASGSGRVEATATTDAGCEGRSELDVAIGSELTPTITSSRPTSLCPGDSVTLDAGDYASYRWSTGETTRTITVRDPGDYRVTVSDAGGCGGTSKPMAVTLNAKPAPVISAPGGTTMCEGESVMLDAGAGYSRYLWTNGARTRTILVRAPGSYAVVVTDSNGCSNASPEVTVEATAKPRPEIVGPALVCRGSTIGYRTRGTAGNSYAWKVSGGTIIAGDGTPEVVVRWGSGGGGTLDLTETVGRLGCSGVAATKAVDVGDRLEPAIIAESSPAFCKGGSATLDAGAGFAGYLWSTGERTRTIVATREGSYTVTVTDANGCTGTSPELAVREKPALVPVVWPRDGVELCEGESARLDAPAGYISYEWSSGERTRSITVSRSGEYSVRVVDTSGCSGTSQKVAVIVHPTPARPVIAIAGDTLIAPAAAAYQWRRDQSIVKGADGRRLAVAYAGIYTVTVIDSNGCSATSDPFELLLVPSRTVRLDTVSARVGDRLHLTMRIEPPLGSDDAIAGYSVRLRVDPKALFAHGVISADRTTAGDAAMLRRERDGGIVVERSRTSAPIVGDELFRIEMEGLASGSPSDLVRIEGIELYPSAEGGATKSTKIISDDNVTIGGHGLVLLSGCVIDHGFAYGKGIAIESVRPNPVPGTAVVSWIAPEGADARLVLVNAAGAEVESFTLPPGTGTSQETRIDVGTAPSGMYMLELRDGIDRGRIPLIITK
jgi:hypothetical protein